MSIHITIDHDRPQPIVTIQYAGSEYRRIVYTIVNREPVTRFSDMVTVERETYDGQSCRVSYSDIAADRDQTPAATLRRAILRHLDDVLYTVLAVDAAHQEAT